MSRILMPTLESYKLTDIASFAGFDHERPHQLTVMPLQRLNGF